MNADAFVVSTMRCRSHCTRPFVIEGDGANGPDKYDLMPPGDVEAEKDDDNYDAENHHQADEIARTELKRKLYQLAASYDRGFGSTPKARNEADDIVEKLGLLNPTQDSARGIDKNEDNVPLKAIWRMIWTSAFDVVSLGASPFAGEQPLLYFTIDYIQFNILLPL